MRSCAFFQGRFQPVSVGHAAALSAVLQGWQRVILGVVYNSPRPEGVDPRFDEYLDVVDAESYGQFRNPFEPTEIMRMWQAYLAVNRLDDRVSCKLVKRLEFESDLNAMYPPESVDLVWPALTGDDAMTDIWRHQLYPAVLGRDIYYVQPSIKLHNARIRELVSKGAPWSKFIPEGAYDVFLEVGGPERMLEAIARRVA